MTMVAKNWPTLLAPGLRKVFHLRLRDREELFKRTQIFNVDTSKKAYEDYQGIGELGQEGWNEFEKTGRVPYDGFDPGWKTRLEHREYTKGIVLQRKLMEDNLYPDAGIPKDFNGKVEKLADSAGVQREKSAADVFINAFTDTGLDAEGFTVSGADGVGLCSTHVDSPSRATTQVNKGAETLTEAGIKETALKMRRFKDDRGQQIAIHPDTILVPPELEESALKILNSELQAGTNNNDPNVLKGRFDVIGWDYLTDPKAWFMIDSVLKSEHLVWLDRVAPEFASEENFDTLTAKFRAYMRYSRGFDDWRWVFGNKF
jgi:hypothetical protein